MKFNTALLHEGVRKEEKYGATLTPIYQNSAFYHQTAEELAKIFDNKAQGFSYTRVSNPTVEAFETRMTKLEGGVASVACASGMAAITNALLNILQAGDEVVSTASLYGGTIDLFHDIEAFGIRTRFVENNNWDEIREAIGEHTKVIYAETIGNPKLDVTDIQTLAQIAHEHKIPLIVDNTVATALLVKPIELGADIVVNSTSKYINGSGNSISGVLTDAGKMKWDVEKFPGLAPYKKFGPFAYTAKLRYGLFRNTGACLAPMNAYLNQLGLETLGLRMERECENAYQLAVWLRDNFKQQGVSVNYPGLESSPWHEIAKKQCHGYFGAILTIRVGSRERAFQVIDALNLAYKLPNIGDTRTLVVHPQSTISLHNTKEQQEDAGVYEDTIRICVGIEDIEDLKADFQQALRLSGELA